MTQLRLCELAGDGEALGRDTDLVEPIYTRAQARRIIMLVGVFWACGAVVFLTRMRGVGLAFFVVAFAAGFMIFPTIGEGYRSQTGVSGMRLVFGLSARGELRRAYMATTFAPLRPRWWRRLTATAEWSGRWVATILGCLLVLDVVLDTLIGTVSRHFG